LAETEAAHLGVFCSPTTFFFKLSYPNASLVLNTGELARVPRVRIPAPPLENAENPEDFRGFLVFWRRVIWGLASRFI